MNDITLSLLVVLAVGLLVVLIFVLVRRNRVEQEKLLKQMALERGWRLEVVRERLMSGYRIFHKEWQLDLLTQSSGGPEAEGSSNIIASTEWRAPGTGNTILIGPKTAQINLGGLGDALIQQVLQMALGTEAAGLMEIKEGSSQFQKDFMIWAKDPEEVRRLISPYLESTLISWKKYSPMIKRTREGLRIELRNTRLKKPQDIDTLVKLGEVLLSQGE
jgi:hypothetical protein